MHNARFLVTFSKKKNKTKNHKKPHKNKKPRPIPGKITACLNFLYELLYNCSVYRVPKQGTQKQQPVVTALPDTSLYRLTYRSSSNACCTSRKASASRLLMSSFRYRAIKGIVFSSLKRRIKFAHTHGSTFVVSDKACQKKKQNKAQQKQTHI